jgi:DNA-binding MarR family transcriptional regulator
MDGIESVAWRGFLKAHAVLLKEIDAVLEADHRLPLSKYAVLHELAEAPKRRMRMRDLAESVALSRSGLSRLVDRLEREGLIGREPCPDDARGAYAVLTRRGARRLEQARPAHLAAVRERFSAHFSPDELKQLAGFWDRLLAPQ